MPLISGRYRLDLVSGISPMHRIVVGVQLIFGE